MTELQSPNPNEVADAVAAYADAVTARADLDDRIASGDNTVTAADIVAADALIARLAVERETARRLSERRRDVASEQASAATLTSLWSDLGEALPLHVDAIADAFDSAVAAVSALVDSVATYNVDANDRRSAIVAAATGARVMHRDDRGHPIPGDTTVGDIDYRAVDCVTSMLEPVDVAAMARQAITVASASHDVEVRRLLVELPHPDRADGTVESVQHKLDPDPYGGPAVAALFA